LCQDGCIESAVKYGNTWAISADAEKVIVDGIKLGKYIKVKE